MSSGGLLGNVEPEQAKKLREITIFGWKKSFGYAFSAIFIGGIWLAKRRSGNYRDCDSGVPDNHISDNCSLGVLPELKKIALLVV
tara:strand:- start:87 stop:341 length:255 start_codon:yes stop_codon:yes gene_type:complete